MVSKKEFHLLGQKIVVKTSEEATLASYAIDIANQKVAELKRRLPLLPPHQLAVLALVEVAGDLVKDRKVMDEYRSELDAKCSGLLAELSASEVVGNAG